MPLITDKKPDAWDELEELVTAIMKECGMKAQRGVSLPIPRGSVNVDVYVEETIGNIIHRIICECKNWRNNIPKDVVHAFRTVMQETGAHRGYIISRVGFQRGAMEAAEATNIELVTFAEFQNVYFEKWIKASIWKIENDVGDFNAYYEASGKPGYSKLKDDKERAVYDAVWHKYLFAGLMLMPFSPYRGMVDNYAFPTLPFDVSKLEKCGIIVPDNLKAAPAYREFFDILTEYARDGFEALRAVSPITRGEAPGVI